MSSVESYKRALTELVDGQKRLTSELKKLKILQEEQEKALLVEKQTSDILKARVTQFAQFLKMFPDLLAVFKVLEFARLATESDFLVVEPVKVASDMAEYYRVLSGGATEGKQRRPSAVSPVTPISVQRQQLNVTESISRATSPIYGGTDDSMQTEDGNDTTLQSDYVQTDTPLGIDAKLWASKGARFRESPRHSQPVVAAVLVTSATQTDDLPQISSSEALHHNHYVTEKHQNPKDTLTRVIQDELPSYLVSTPLGLDSVALSFLNDEHQQKRINDSKLTSTTKTSGGRTHHHMSLEDEHEQHDMSEQLLHCRQQLAVSKATSQGLKQQVQILLAQNKKLQQLDSQSRVWSMVQAPAAWDNLSSPGDEEPQRLSSSTAGPTTTFPQLSRLAAACSVPRPPPTVRSSRDGSLGSRNAARRGGPFVPFDATFNTPPTPAASLSTHNNSNNAYPELSMFISYFVEDICMLLREARSLMQDLDAIHWRLSVFQEQQYGIITKGESSMTGQECPSTRGSSRRTKMRTDLETRHETDKPALLSSSDPFATCSATSMLRISQIICGSFVADHTPPRHVSVLQAISDSRRNAADRFAKSDMTDDPALLLLKQCWSTVEQFLDGQVRHAQTMIFLREPMLESMMKNSTSFREIVQRASAAN